MTRNLRCDGPQLHGVLGENFIEVACKNVRCGKRAGVLVIHRFDLPSGKLVSTRKYKDPASINKREERDDAPGHCLPVRDA